VTKSASESQRHGTEIRLTGGTLPPTRPVYHAVGPEYFVGRVLVEEQTVDYWELIEAANKQVDIYNSAEEFFRGFATLPTYVQHLLATYWCQSEINNGGFDQFFFNSTGILAPEAEAGFRAMGLSEVADLLVEAIGRFGGRYPREREERQIAMDSLPSVGTRTFLYTGRRFADLDDRFYSLLPGHAFFQHAEAYAALHRDC